MGIQLERAKDLKAVYELVGKLRTALIEDLDTGGTFADQVGLELVREVLITIQDFRNSVRPNGTFNPYLWKLAVDSIDKLEARALELGLMKKDEQTQTGGSHANTLYQNSNR